jgi:DedD protein
MTDADDVQLQIKKKARRRLVGALAFAAFAALVLPMVMDQEPAPPTQEVDLRIPAPDGGKPFAPASQPLPPPPEPVPSSTSPSAALPADAAATRTAAPPAAAAPAAAQPSRPAAAVNPEGKPKGEAQGEAQGDVRADHAAEARTKAEAKPKPAEKSDKTEKPEKTAGKNARPAEGDDADRVAAILSGKPAPAAAASSYVILIGAFASEANVQNIKAKLAEQGIKVYTEPLDSPQGRKTRVRAGPFPKREAAEKALEKMKRIGISGVIAAKQ